MFRMPLPKLPGFMADGWNEESCSENPLHLAATLACGQNFRWRHDTHGVWWSTIGESLVALWQHENRPNTPLYWQTYPVANQRNLVRDYLRLDFDLDGNASRWIASEPRIAPILDAYRGLRILRQPPEECLFAFQCAACNTVQKIERSVNFLARHYGTQIASNEFAPRFSHKQNAMDRFEGFYTFPSVNAIAHASEEHLRSGLWGYRAPRLIAVARALLQMPPNWLSELRQKPHLEARTALTQFHGIGTKLADCICLFALDKDEALPVDTHIRQIAVRLFAPELAGKSLTPTVYARIESAFRDRFGSTAGWAQQYLFFPELPRAEQYRRIG